MSLPEFERTRILQRLLSPRDSSELVVPNGDDAAVLRVSGQLVVTTDALVEGVDFSSWAPWDAVGAKALAVNLSDLAAMGAEPMAFVNALCLPASFSDENLESLARGMAACGVGCVGGDLSRIDGPVVISITAFGTIGAGQAITRSGARVGDGIYVSGTLGGAAAGLAVLMARGPRVSSLRAALEVHSDDDVRSAVAAQLAPTPRVVLGRLLRGVATSCIDISDGLLQDLAHVLVKSGVGATLSRDALPLHPAVRKVAVDEKHVWSMALAGGEDFQLLFTARDHGAVLAAAEDAGTPVQKIGDVTERGLVVTELCELDFDDVTLLDRGRAPGELEQAGLLGFRHF